MDGQPQEQLVYAPASLEHGYLVPLKPGLDG